MAKTLEQFFGEIGLHLPEGATLHYCSTSSTWRAKTDTNDWVLSNYYDVNWDWVANKTTQGVNFGPDLRDLPYKSSFMFIPLDIITKRIPRDGWLPISVAPTNGDFILGVDDDEFKIPHIVNWNGYHWEDSYDIDSYGDRTVRHPKWWMPMPSTDALKYP